jgi:hypothetical protein
MPMKFLKLLLATAAITTILLAFRDRETGGWIRPEIGGSDGDDPEIIREPVLGYDGMDVDTLIDWMDEAELDDGTLADIEAYERAHRNRGAVLDVIAERLG